MLTKITVKRNHQYRNIKTGKIVTVTDVVFATADGITAGYVVKVREYDFVRCDGSKFHAAISSRAIDGDQFETTVTFKYNLP